MFVCYCGAVLYIRVLKHELSENNVSNSVVSRKMHCVSVKKTNNLKPSVGEKKSMFIVRIIEDVSEISKNLLNCRV